MKIEDIVQDKLRFVFHNESIVFDKTRFAGGLTNYNYIMNIGDTEYVIRQPGGMTDLMINRRTEKINNQIASELGLNSECIYFDEMTGIKISVYIKDSTNIALTDPCRPVNLKAVSNLMKRIHNSPRRFPNTFDWKSELTKYEEIVTMLNGDLFYDYQILKSELIEFVKNQVTSVTVTPCHNDTVPENFLSDAQGNSYLIDWEYAGMNDPLWDVAAYILESRLSEEAIQYLVSDYFEKAPTPEELMRLKSYMLIQDLLWSVWALIRHYNGDDFLDYCNYRYERFRKNIKSVLSVADYPIAEMVKYT